MNEEELRHTLRTIATTYLLFYERDAAEGRVLSAFSALKAQLADAQKEVHDWLADKQRYVEVVEAERDTARTALTEAEKERDLESLSRDYFRKQHLATAGLLASMTAERDALRAERDAWKILREEQKPLQFVQRPLSEHLAAERERERAKCEAEVVAYLLPAGESIVTPSVFEKACGIERGEHRPPAEPKPEGA